MDIDFVDIDFLSITKGVNIFKVNNNNNNNKRIKSVFKAKHQADNNNKNLKEN